MVTPQVRTASESSRRPSTQHSHRSRYERLLAAALGLAVAATAAVAFAVPTATTSTTDDFASVQQTSQVARGKATAPGSAIVDPHGGSDSSL